jgi:mono/diheme cytochrome c family protein
VSRAARVRRAVVIAVLASVAVSARAHAYTPAVDYALNCQGCHRADGGGTPGSIPPLAGSVARFLAVAGGREYLAQVPGVAQAPLDDAALAAVLNWMLTRFDAEHVPTQFPPYAPDEVGRLRAHPLTDVETVRTRLLAGMR